MTRTLDAWFLRWQVKLLLLLGQTQKALVRVEEWLVHEPTDLYGLATQAHLLAASGDKPAAAEALTRLVSLQPQQASAWFNLGFLREEMGELEAAEAAFRRATELDPLLDRAWYGLGLTLIGLRRWDEALAALRKNTELQPMSPYGWYQLARVHVDRQEPEEAAKIIRHLRKFEPKVAAQLERETGLGATPA
jgi:tetratricopeptide (TPR) repeat protein